MILFGTIMACAAGVALPVHLFLFGRVIDQFVSYSIAIGNSALSNISTPSATDCSPEVIVDSPAFIEYLNSSRGHFCFDPLNNGTDPVTSNIVSYACNPRATLQTNVGFFSIYYVILATCVLIAIFLSTTFWNLSAYRQTRRMRLAFYRSILRQEVGWFDVTEASQLNTRLVE